jgi:hypothetical protein
MLIIGSRALGIQAPSLLTRKPRDLDVIMTFPEFQAWAKTNRSKMASIRPLSDAKTLAITRSGIKIEVETAWEGTAAHSLWTKLNQTTQRIKVFPELGSYEIEPHQNGEYAAVVAPLWALLALKLSHRYLKNSPHFLKTMRDIQALRGHGVTLDEWAQAWLKVREAGTYVYKHPNLNQSKDAFFNGDGVQYVFDHDSIHVAVARLPGQPAYSLYLKDGEQVKVDKNKWDALPEEYRLNGVVEEATVLALERSQIPNRGKGVDPRRSFEIALMKVCTSITSGWFREYAWEHYDQVMAIYDPEYADKFWALADAGKVKPYQGSTY